MTISPCSLSWADTAASTFGRLFGSRTPRLPARTPILRLPLSPRKSLAGFLAATITGAIIAIGFWGWVAPLRHGGTATSWHWDNISSGTLPSLHSPVSSGTALFCAGGWVGLGVIGLFSGIVSGVAEALGMPSSSLFLPYSHEANSTLLD